MCVPPPVIPGSTTGSGGGFVQMLPVKPENNDANSTTPSQYVDAVDGKCPAGSHEAGGSPGNAGQPGTGFVNCRLDNSPVNSQATLPTSTSPEQPPADTLPGSAEQIDPLLRLTQQTCPPLPIDASGRCPGIDMRGGGLGLPPVKEYDTIKEKSLLPDGSCDGVFDPSTNKCYEGSNHAPACPGAADTDASHGRDIYGYCHDQNGAQLPDTECSILEGVHVASDHRQICFIGQDIARAPDGTCRSGYFPTGVNNDQCSLKIHDPLPDGSCPAGYHNIPAPAAAVPRGTLCKLNVLKLTNDDLTSELPGGYCPVGYQKRSGFAEHQCFRIT